MPNKKVTRLRKLCGLLAGHAWRQAERATEAAIELLRPSLPDGQEELTLLDFLLYLGEWLQANRDRLTAIDNQHLHELQIDRNLREKRDASTAALREALLQLRDSLDGLFGLGGGAKIFEDAPRIPTDPVALHQFTGHVRNNLDDEDFPMPKPRQKGFMLDRKAAVADIDGPYQELGAALLALEGTGSDSKYSQSRKDSEVNEVDVFSGKAARFLEAFYDLVGLDGLSDRVRRSSHRAADDDEEDEDASGDESLSEPDDEEDSEPEPDS